MSSTNPQGVLSEWDELQIKFGNYAPRTREVPIAELNQIAVNAAESVDLLEACSLSDLNELEDVESDEVLQVYRKRRLEELKAAAAVNCFGRLESVTADNYVEEVTEASRSRPGQVVLLLLTSRSTSTTSQQALNSAWIELVSRHRYVKFCIGVASEIIPDWPETSVPTVLVYRDGAALHTFRGSAIWGSTQWITPDCVEWVLWRSGLLTSCRQDADPRPPNSPPVELLIQDAKKLQDDGDDDSDHHNLHSNGISSNHPSRMDDRNYSSLALERAFRLK